MRKRMNEEPVLTRNPSPDFAEVKKQLAKTSTNCVNIAKCTYRGTLANFDNGHYKQGGVDYISLRCPRCFSHQGRLQAKDIAGGMSETEIQLAFRG